MSKTDYYGDLRRVDEKTDVSAYGVLLLELITGRQALDRSQKSLVLWAKPEILM
ncbi:hypothetical protein TanjilG_07557 [Lupinus angustifolius]|uniref:Serine-threonine/tyrosine-protein kinase catalytic domain-containing protein n=1 Tax=Lupinus angustifolius TaxID=3871 RepID=A0A1J7GI15_LUPAN|nr:hypothetical protein TanjilG_07557 [Lupinus angustifolius]